MQTLGNDLKNSIVLNLIPGIQLTSGFYHIEAFISTTTTNRHETWTHFSSNNYIPITVGKDVYAIDFTITEYTIASLSSASPHAPFYPTRKSIRMRVDQLILLNLAAKLLNFK